LSSPFVIHTMIRSLSCERPWKRGKPILSPPFRFPSAPDGDDDLVPRYQPPPATTTPKEQIQVNDHHSTAATCDTLLDTVSDNWKNLEVKKTIIGDKIQLLITRGNSTREIILCEQTTKLVGTYASKKCTVRQDGYVQIGKTMIHQIVMGRFSPAWDDMVTGARRYWGTRRDEDVSKVRIETGHINSDRCDPNLCNLILLPKALNIAMMVGEPQNRGGSYRGHLSYYGTSQC
jgi:hypothetical protein